VAPLLQPVGARVMSQKMQDIVENQGRQKDLLQKIAAIDKRKILSKNSIRNILKDEPQSIQELAEIKGVGSQKAFILRDIILLFQNENSE